MYMHLVHVLPLTIQLVAQNYSLPSGLGLKSGSEAPLSQDLEGVLYKL